VFGPLDDGAAEQIAGLIAPLSTPDRARLVEAVTSVRMTTLAI